MKRHNLLLGFFIFCLIPLHAERVSMDKAEKVAEQHLQSQTTVSKASLKPVHTGFKQKADLRSGGEEEAMYYVFNEENNGGFVIVSADDVAVPVLGYSHTGNYDPDNLPPGLVYWMGFLSSEIAHAVENKIPQSPEIREQWDNYLNGNTSALRATTAVAPLLQTEWSQGTPYSDLTPHVTGCVATAMAQVMKYYNHPETRTITIPGYTTNTNGYIIGDTPGATYDWDNMNNTYNNYPIPYTEIEAAAVAKLMYDCGVSVKMDYVAGASGASSYDAITALRNYFQYDKSIQLKWRVYYTDTDWDGILISEITAGRPVLYSGRTADSGHAFVCDGYDDANPTRFHFNWGWGGAYQNTYFLTTALDPSSPGNGYTNDQSILMNIKPDEGGSGIPEFKLLGNLTIEKTTLKIGEAFSIAGGAYLVDYASSGAKRDCGVALVDDNDQIVALAGETNQWTVISNIGCSVPSVSPGDYYLRVVFRLEGESSWTIVTGEIGSIDRIAITVLDEAVTHNIKIEDNYRYTPFTSTAASVDRGETFTVSPLFKNIGTTPFSGDLGVALVDNNDIILELIGIIGTNISLDAGSSSLYLFSTNALCAVSSAISAGSYKIKAVAKPIGEEWSFVYGETADVVDILPLVVTAGIVEDNSNLVLNSDFTVNPNPMEQFSPVEISIKVWNQSEHYYNGSFELVLC